MGKLERCPTCGRDISQNAGACPFCGEPLSAGWAEEAQRRRIHEEERAHSQLKRRRARKRLWLAVILTPVVALVSFRWFLSGQDGAENHPVNPEALARFEGLFNDTLANGRPQDRAIDLARCAVVLRKSGLRSEAKEVRALSDQIDSSIAANAERVAGYERGFMEDAGAQIVACRKLVVAVRAGKKSLD